MRVVHLVLLICALPCSVVSAQRLPQFEVATVKLSPARTSAEKAAVVIRRGPVYFDWPQISIRELVMFAYEVDGERVLAPDALMQKRFDISAKAPEPVNEHQRNLMLQSLLLERFDLVVHPETRTLPVYELTIAKGGLKMLDSSLGKPNDPRAAPLPEQKEGGSLWIDPGKGLTKSRTRTEDGVTLAAGRKVPMSSIEFLLSRRLVYFDRKRILVDKSGLTETYDFGIQFLDPSAEVNNIPKASKNIPGIFSAVEHYLGLRIDAKNGPVEVMVVDSANLDPGEN